MNTFLRETRTIQWVNNTGADVSSGDVVLLASGKLAICMEDIASDATGPVTTEGDHKLAATTAEAWARGTQLYWNSSTEKLTKFPSINRPLAGTAANAKTATTDTTAEVSLNRNWDNAFTGQTLNESSTAVTLAYSSVTCDVGKVTCITSGSSGSAVTLPSVVASSMASGFTFTVANFGLESGTGCTVAVYVSPAAADKIQGPDVWGTANKDWYQVAGTAKPGDYIKLVSVAGVGYQVTEIRGIWTQES